MKGAHSIVQGDVLETLRALPDCSFDALLCDPPYGFSFMGKTWDYDVPSVDVWREALRVLKPGAPLLAFGGARTFHRICVGIEDAGFELRDVLMWLYGKGFPKSQNVSLALSKAGASEQLVRDWDGMGSALKPAYEPIILARKPLIGTMVENVTAWGVGGIDIDGSRVGYASAEDQAAAAAAAMRAGSDQNAGRHAYGQFNNGAATIAAYHEKQGMGRWPANLLLDEHAAAALDASVQPTKSPKAYRPKRRDLDPGAVPIAPRSEDEPEQGYGDSGGPSRFFYCAKVSTKERELGCESLPEKLGGSSMAHNNGNAETRIDGAPVRKARNHHPTLKPLSVTRWLATLIKPPGEGATLLVPFSGAGSEMIGALQAGWPAVFGIEGEAEYVAIAEARIAAWRER